MRWFTTIAALALFMMPLHGRAAQTDTRARAYLSSALQAMGGEAKLRAMRGIEYTVVGDRTMIEQSERPEGPYYRDLIEQHVIHDFAHHRGLLAGFHAAHSQDYTWWRDQTYPPAMSTFVYNDDVAARLTDGKFSYAGGSPDPEQEAFEPERLLLTAQDAADLRLLGDVTLHGVVHHVLGFTWNGSPCKLYLNADTGLPWAIEWKRAYPDQLHLYMWGDVTSKITYTAWTLEPHGIAFPREWSFEHIGLPDKHLTVLSVAVDPPIDESALTIPSDIYQAHHGGPNPYGVDNIPFGFGGDPQNELAPGVTQYPGVVFNVAAIDEPGGVFLLEAPLSAKYTQQAIDWAAKTYGKPVVGLITTTADWAHIAGVRQAVADNVPLYVLDLNKPLITSIVSRPHTMHPDLLQTHPRTPRLLTVAAPMTLGSGTNRFTLIPYRGDWGERKMMVYFPGHQLLYTSDLISPDPKGMWMTPLYVEELRAAVEQHHLQVQRIFGMEFPRSAAYATVLDSLKRFLEEGSGGH